MALIVFGLFIMLGNWQLDRADQKRLLLQEFELGLAGEPVPLSNAQRFQRVKLTGHYQTGRQLLLDNMVARGRAGFQVLTPFVTEQGQQVIVNRGWRPFEFSRAELPDVSVDEDMRTIIGFVDRLPQAGLTLTGETDADLRNEFPRLVHFPTMDKLSRLYDRELFPFVVKLESGQVDGYLLDWKVATFGPDRHLAYALQWYSLALVVAIVTVVMHRRRKKKPDE